MGNYDTRQMVMLGKISIKDILILKKILVMCTLVLQVMDLIHLETRTYSTVHGW
jgi:hypothetical protein